MQQNVIVMEQLANGTKACAVNPSNLEDRNSLAKQLFTADCKEGATVRGLKQMLQPALSASLSARKCFAKAVFREITGQSFKKKWGGSVRRATAEIIGPAVSVDAPHLGMPGGKKRYNLLG